MLSPLPPLTPSPRVPMSSSPERTTLSVSSFLSHKLILIGDIFTAAFLFCFVSCTDQRVCDMLQRFEDIISAAE